MRKDLPWAPGDIVGKMDPDDCRRLIIRLKNKASDLLKDSLDTKEIATDMNNKFWISYGVKLALEEVHHFLLDEKWSYTNDIQMLVNWYEEAKK